MEESDFSSLCRPSITSYHLESGVRHACSQIWAAKPLTKAGKDAIPKLHRIDEERVSFMH